MKPCVKVEGTAAFIYINYIWLQIEAIVATFFASPLSYPHCLFQRPKPSFKPLEKLEAVDKRNPSLVRAAQVAAVEEYRVKVHFDGWDDIYDDWFDADSFDLHPVGWCEKTGHALEPPLSKYAEQRCALYRFAALLKLYSY